MKAWFWNAEENRLRAFWRLCTQLLLLVTIMIPLLIPGGLLFITAMQASPPGGGSIQDLSGEYLTSMFLLYPVPVLASTLGLLIAILTSIWLCGRFIDRRRFNEFGLQLNSRWWEDLVAGFLLGAFLISIIFVIELYLGWIQVSGWIVHPPHMSFGPAAALVLANYIIAGFHEELLSRGYQLRNLAEGLNGILGGPKRAILGANLIAAVIFGVLHTTNPHANFISTFNIFLAGGTLLASGYLLTGELAIPTGVHIAWNLFQGGVFGFPVSGGRIGAVSLIQIQQSGPDLWTGGTFGPEAGLLGLFAILLGSLLITLYVRWRTGRMALFVSLARYTPDQQ